MPVMGLGLTGLSGEQFAMLLVSVAGGGGSAEQLGVGQHFGGGLAGIPVGSDEVDLGTVEFFDNAVAAGALTIPELVGVLIGVGMVQFPSPYAVRTSAYALDALVTSGRITVEDAMALIDGMVPCARPGEAGLLARQSRPGRLGCTTPSPMKSSRSSPTAC